jgi:hypothetical protein
MKQDEQELIARTLGGDENSYKVLIDRYKQGLYHHCFRIMRDEDDASLRIVSIFKTQYNDGAVSSVDYQSDNIMPLDLYNQMHQ